jgi:hypothetical protein
VEFLLFCKNNAHFCEGVKEACLKYLLMWVTLLFPTLR